MSLPRLSVRRPVATAMFFLAAVLLGLLSLQQLAVDLLPDLNYPRLLVRTRLPNAAPGEVVEFITRPVEEALGAVSGIKRITSRSREGLSLVTLEFYWGQNMDYAALTAREKLDEIRLLLPESAERPQVLRLDPSARPIMEVAVWGIEAGRLTDLCRQLLRRRLEQIRGVALVEVSGGVERQIEVQIDPAKLLTQNITVEQIAAALQANNLSAGGGAVKQGRYRFAIRIEGEFRSPEEIRQIAVAGGWGSLPILLGDIARVHYIPKERESLARLNGQETVGLLITREAGSNTVQVSRAIRETLRQIQSEIPELEYRIVSQQATFIEQSIGNVFSALLWGGALAFLALFLFLHNLRHPLNIGIAMPISIIATFTCMRFAGVSLNMVSLGGLALGIGMLVDNSIVVLENIFRRREEGADWVNASVEGAREVAMPVLASTLTTCAVFLPVIYVEGLAGQLFRDQSLTVVFSLLASLMVALSLLPVLASRFRGRRTGGNPDQNFPNSGDKPGEEESQAPPREQNRAHGGKERNRKGKFIKATGFVSGLVIGFFRGMAQAAGQIYRALSLPVFRVFDAGLLRLYAGYHRLLRYCLAHKSLTLAAAVAACLIAAGIAIHLDRRLLPPLHPDEARLRIELPPETTLYQTAQVVAAIEENFLHDPAVQQVFSQTGARESILQAAEQDAPYRALITAKRNPDFTLPGDDFVARLRRLLPQTYQYQYAFESGEQAYTEILGLEGNDIQIDLKGSSHALLLPVAQQIESALSNLEGLKDVHLSYQPGAIQYAITIDRAKAALYGITTAQVANALQSRVSRIVATRVKEFDRSIEVLVRPGIEQRDSWEDIYRHLLNPQENPGQPVALPLKEVIRYQKMPTTEEILHQDQEETIRVFAALENLPRQQAVKQVQQILSAMDFPENVRAAIGGQQTELRSSLKSIRNALLLSIALIYMILAAQFESLRYPLLILLAVPFGLIGAIWLLALTGHSLNLISGIGFIVLSGIVVNDAIIKIDFINQARLRGKSVRQAILEASQKRFRPILLTTITTVFGLLPMAVSGGSGAELRQPLAIVIVGGLTLATFLTLILIPVVYEALSSKK